jgi:hypothetical protein
LQAAWGDLQGIPMRDMSGGGSVPTVEKLKELLHAVYPHFNLVIEEHKISYHHFAEDCIHSGFYFFKKS